jgi:hypothetical protein
MAMVGLEGDFRRFFGVPSQSCSEVVDELARVGIAHAHDLSVLAYEALAHFRPLAFSYLAVTTPDASLGVYLVRHPRLAVRPVAVELPARNLAFDPVACLVVDPDEVTDRMAR